MSDTKLLLVRGLPGAGKSTYAKSLVPMVYDIHLETDMYFCLSGDYKWDGTQLGRAHNWCQDQVKQALLSGKSVVVSNTFTKKWEMKPYFDMAKELNITVSVTELKTVFQNIHGVSEEHITKMRQRWEVL